MGAAKHCPALRYRVEAERIISCPQTRAMDHSKLESIGFPSARTAWPPALPIPLEQLPRLLLSCCVCVWVYLETRSFQLNCKMKHRDHNSSNSFSAHTHTHPPTSILPPMQNPGNRKKKKKKYISLTEVEKSRYSADERRGFGGGEEVATQQSTFGSSF